MKLVFAAGVGLAMALLAGSANAQTAPTVGGTQESQSICSECRTTGNPIGDEVRAPATNVEPSRIRRNARRPAPATRSAPAAPPAPTAAELIAAAGEQLTAAGVACSVVDVSRPGFTAAQEAIYEASCSEGLGYMVIASAPPKAFSCLVLQGTAANARLRDPAAPAGQQCTLTANQNGLTVMGDWAKQAGAKCTIDEAVWIGKSETASDIYEIGCSGEDGYWLENAASTWTLKGCLEVALLGAQCRFTTAAEQGAWAHTRLAGSPGAGCDVTTVRMMGSSANGRYYEAKCAAADEGYIFRVDNSYATQQVYPCATAQNIGGGCTLTRAPAASAPAA